MGNKFEKICFCMNQKEAYLPSEEQVIHPLLIFKNNNIEYFHAIYKLYCL